MIVPIYSGKNQSSAIVVPRPTQYQYWDGEEGPWAMVPYARLYPKPPPTLYSQVPPPVYRSGGNVPPMKLQMGWDNEDGVFILADSNKAFLPPRVQTTDLWDANQTYPL
jgi:hypothetical protein